MRPTPASPSSVDLEPGQVDRLDLAGEGAADPLLGLVALDRGEEADGAEVDAEDRHPGAGEAAQRVQDRAVAAEDDAEVRARLVAGDDFDALGGVAVLGELVRGADQPPAGLAGDRDGDRDRLGGGRRVRVGDQRGGLHLSTSTAAWIAASRSATGGPSPPHQRKVSRLPFGPGQPGGGDAAHRQAVLGGGLGDGVDRLAAVAAVADDAAADPLAAELELRLDHRQRLAAGRQAAAPPRAGSWPGR